MRRILAVTKTYSSMVREKFPRGTVKIWDSFRRANEEYLEICRRGSTKMYVQCNQRVDQVRKNQKIKY